MSGFFTESLESRDPDIFRAVCEELDRQQTQIELIASENIVSRAVLEAQGSVLTNKYAEGYPGKRYYGGCEFVDVVEDLARERAKELFGCSYVNVQPNSGSQANQGVMMALAQPGDTILGMSLASGGHLTHGAAPNQSGKWFNAIQYGVRREDALIDYEEVERLAREHKPKVIIAGASAYPRVIDWARFRKIADSVGAFLFVDMAHYAGLVAAGVYPSPIPHAHVTTTTTHKTLRGPRGGMILSNDEELGKKINSCIFPGMQGGPLMHVIAGKAVCFKEAQSDAFKTYQQQVIRNAARLADGLASAGFRIVSGGTDNHLVLVDVWSRNGSEGITGKVAEASLGRAGITVNKNAIPFDQHPPMVASGIRIGTPAVTTRGMAETEMDVITGFIARVFAAPDDESVAQAVRADVEALCRTFPLYPDRAH